MADTNKKEPSEYESIPLLPPSTFQKALEMMNVFVDESGRGKSEEIACTPKALEILRNCHGQFVALLASELVSCEEGTPAKNRKTGGEDMGERVRTIMPKDVTAALQRLEFHDILSKLQEKSDDDAKGLLNSALPSEKKTSKRKRKGPFKNSTKSEEELVQEQERLFALSVAKAKERMKTE